MLRLSLAYLVTEVVAIEDIDPVWSGVVDAAASWPVPRVVTAALKLGKDAGLGW